MPESVFANTHSKAKQNFVELVREFGDKVEYIVRDNSDGGEEITLEELDRSRTIQKNRYWRPSMPMTNKPQNRDLEEMKLAMMEAGDKAGAENLRWRLRKGTLKHADLTPRQLELLDKYPENPEV